MSKNVLFVLGSQACVPGDPLRAAKDLGYRTTILSARTPCGIPDGLVDRHVSADLNDFVGVRRIVDAIHDDIPVDAIICYDDQAVPVAARLASHLHLPGNPINAADAARDKFLMKSQFQARNVPIAPYVLAQHEDHAADWSASNGYPVVVKPLRGSASQGVIRADNEIELREAYRRARRIVRDYGLDTGGRTDSELLVETYLEGDEFSVELLIQDAVPVALCVFEKPDPLVGPFFEETLYVTPTRLAYDRESEIIAIACRAACALGLTTGMAHCELRASNRGIFVIEVAARLIGGACSRVFRSILEEDIHKYVLRLALGEQVTVPRGCAGAAGAMMLPIPREGRLEEVVGADGASGVPHINDVIITADPGDVVVPFPEQSCYIGFLTAAAETPSIVATALREASSRIQLRLSPLDCEHWSRSITDHQNYVAPSSLDIRTLAGYTDDEARDCVTRIIASTQFGELPSELAVAQAQSCVKWLESGHRGATTPSFWLLSRDRAVALGSNDGAICFVSCLGVDTECRRAGLGTALVRSIMALFARKGCELMRVLLDPRNAAATALYEALGFEREASVEQSCHC